LHITINFRVAPAINVANPSEGEVKVAIKACPVTFEDIRAVCLHGLIQSGYI
jgi:hypothetical protein